MDRHKRQIREEAAARMREGKTPLLELAREYGVSTNTLRAWLRESDARQKALDAAKRVGAALSKEKLNLASQRQRLLMHALEQSPATIIVTDAEGRIVYANPRFVETTGYQVAEVLGKNPRLLKSGETPPEEYQRLWKTILSGKVWRGVFHNKRKDGTLYWERASISPVFDARGKIAHFMAVKEDITAFVEAEKARRRIEARFSAVFAALSQAIVLLDRDGRILLANPAAAALFGQALKPGEAFAELNLRWLDEKKHALLCRELPLFDVLTKGREKVVMPKVGVIPPTGGERWVSASAQALALPESLETAMLMVFETSHP
ncbi:MAG: PAS domain S-box protein [Rhodocyclaceae bacterium]|nr:PAS domain S-box protein [Rhodocyclaceae bacterium]